DDVGSARERDAESQRRALTKVGGLLDKEGVFQVAVNLLRALQGVVARAVVDHDDFHRGRIQGLQRGPEAFETHAQSLGFVVGRDDERERERHLVALGARGPDESGGKEGSERDGGSGVRGGDRRVDAPRATTHVHNDVIDYVVTVKVVVEQQVARLELGQRHVNNVRVLRFRGARDGYPRARPGPLDETRTVKAHARALAAPDVGHADLGFGVLHGLVALGGTSHLGDRGRRDRGLDRVDDFVGGTLASHGRRRRDGLLFAGGAVRLGGRHAGTYLVGNDLTLESGRHGVEGRLRGVLELDVLLEETLQFVRRVLRFGALRGDFGDGVLQGRLLTLVGLDQFVEVADHLVLVDLGGVSLGDVLIEQREALRADRAEHVGANDRDDQLLRGGFGDRAFLRLLGLEIDNVGVDGRQIAHLRVVLIRRDFAANLLSREGRREIGDLLLGDRNGTRTDRGG